VLEDFEITYNPGHEMDAKSLKQAIIVQLPPRPATPATLARNLGPYCVHVKKTVGGVTLEGDVCISCAYSFPLHVSCTVTIKVTLST
jgi:hypothetical protein